VVRWGGEKISPIQYNTYEVGGIDAEVEIGDGDDAEAVYRDVYERLAKLGDEQALAKCEQWEQHVRHAAGQVHKAK
jgi:hypothetical protein